VGFYGGVNYGFGYGGVGYEGGYWNNGAFYYNRSVNNVNVTNIHNVYNKTVINGTRVNHVSYNGGAGGINVRPTQAEETAAHEQHRSPTAMQTQHVHAASSNHALLASVNHGRPAIAATPKPSAFSGHGVVAARQAGTTYKAAQDKATENKTVATRPNENRAAENKAAASRSNENRAAENKAAASRSNENRAAENKAAASRSNQNRTETAAHAQPAPRPQAAPRPEARPESAPRPEKKASGGREPRQ